MVIPSILCEIDNAVNDVIEDSVSIKKENIIFRGENRDYGMRMETRLCRFFLETNKEWDGFTNERKEKVLKMISGEMLDENYGKGRGPFENYRDFEEHMFSTRRFRGDASLDEKRQIVKMMWEHFFGDSPLRTKFADVQHLGGMTNWIDFTTNVYVALFFACWGEYDEPGRVVFVRKDIFKVEEAQSVYVNPLQHSILVRPPDGGYIEIMPETVINVPKEQKEQILVELETYFNLSSKTIYHDVFGYVRNQKEFFPKMYNHGDNVVPGISIRPDGSIGV